MPNIFCHKLQKELPALTYLPYPGSLGERIQREISQEAWQSWLKEQTKIINELRLHLGDPHTRQILEGHMKTFLFGKEN